jgi:hypothetical protein
VPEKRSVDRKGAAGLCGADVMCRPLSDSHPFQTTFRDTKTTVSITSFEFPFFYSDFLGDNHGLVA